MKSRKFGVLAIMFILMFLLPALIIPFNDSDEIGLINDEEDFSDNLLANGNSNLSLIISFNTNNFSQSVIDNFTFHGGVVMKGPWNESFSTISGFAGILPSVNLTNFKTDNPSATVETDEQIETQMNYIVVQSNAMNTTWSINGYTGNTNSTTAILDSGINPNNTYFPDGYETIDLTGDIVKWKDYVQDISTPYDDNGHGTFISSVIAGTGDLPSNYSNKIELTYSANYSHEILFGTDDWGIDYSFKLATFNVSKENSQIFINSSWIELADGIENFNLILYNSTSLVNQSILVESQYNQTYHNIQQSGAGLYDIYIKYKREEEKFPNFTLNLETSFFAEEYIENKTHFTGISNASKLASYKVVDATGIGNVSSLISAMEDVILNKLSLHITAVCLSVATFGDDVATINEVINNLIDAGILVVIAAGNRGLQSAEAINKLASNKKAIVVGAINDADQVTTYSSIGKTFDEDEDDEMIKPDLVAPGGSKLQGHRSVISANYFNNKTIAKYGTSISAAVVCGAIQLLIEAKWNDWTTWNGLDTRELAKLVKASLLMTATETIVDREDDPDTEYDESDYSPTTNLGGKDIHEGYGRLNVDSAIDALTKNISVGLYNSHFNLTTSSANPLGKHAYSRRINLSYDVQYRFNLTLESPSAVFDMYLYCANETTKFGEPILLSQVIAPLPTQPSVMYFTPRDNQTECILVIKAIIGTSNFSLNISTLQNDYAPVLTGGYIASSSPATNYTIDTYTFFVNYTDNDTSNAPPKYVYMEVEGVNYTMSKLNFLDNVYTDGVWYWLTNFQFSSEGTKQFKFWANDGFHFERFPDTGDLSIVIIPHTTKELPYSEDFEDSAGDWTTDGDGWNRLWQSNTFDDRSRIYDYLGLDWYAFYFGTTIVPALPYSYQPLIPTGDWISGSLTSPMINLTSLGEYDNPIAKLGIRVSLNPLDEMDLEINVNSTPVWTALKSYSGEYEWDLDVLNLSEYKGSYIRLRFTADLDVLPDTINYKGFMLDYISIENYTNQNDHELSSSYLLSVVSPNINEVQYKYDMYTFSIDYLDADPENNYPDYVFIEINNQNYTMNNIDGDWWANSSTGIRFEKGLFIGDFADLKFRFHAYDGETIYSTQWYNDATKLIEFDNPNPENYTKASNYMGYDFNVETFEDFYITGIPEPRESTVWVTPDDTWHSMDYLGLGEYYAYCGIGQINFFTEDIGYGQNWNARLLTFPLNLGSDHKNYIQFHQNISLEDESPPEFPFDPGYDGDDLDKCIISISTDFGTTWTELISYNYENNQEAFVYIDISDYSGKAVMIRFELDSNDYDSGLFDYLLGNGVGWFIKDLFIGYNQSADFTAPEITFISPAEASTLILGQMINATIADNVAIDPDRVNLYINDVWVNATFVNGTLTYFWDTSLWNDGVYTIKIVAYDIENNRAEETVVVVVDNLLDWLGWLPWLIFILAIVAITVVLALIILYRGKEWVDGIKTKRGIKEDKVRKSQKEKDKKLKVMESVSKEELKGRPYTYKCRNCNSWFVDAKYEWMCPNCDTDQLYFAYHCPMCNKWTIKDEPGKYNCKKCKIKLIKSKKEDVKTILEKGNIVLNEFEREED